MATSKSAAKPAEPEIDPDLVDHVHVVTRGPDGKPRQSPGFVVMVDDDATDEEKSAAHNEVKDV